VVPYLPGDPAADADSLDLAGAADSVGGFLGSLHAPAPTDAPANPFRGVPLADRADALAVNLRLLSDAVNREAVQRVWAAAIAAPGYAGPPRWLHGDLHPANILVSGGRVSGVIDFGDITAGDPATDLAVAWMLLPLEYHAAFRAAYRSARTGPAGAAADGAPEDGAPADGALQGPAWTALWIRALGWALNLAIVFLAHSADNPQLLNVGRRTRAPRPRITRLPLSTSRYQCDITLIGRRVTDSAPTGGDRHEHIQRQHRPERLSRVVADAPATRPAAPDPPLGVPPPPLLRDGAHNRRHYRDRRGHHLPLLRRLRLGGLLPGHRRVESRRWLLVHEHRSLRRRPNLNLAKARGSASS
jgi:Phosphotransferase enzyme family